MTDESKLSKAQFASLMEVANCPHHCPAPEIPVTRADLLVELGYIQHLQGRFRMTTLGRRITERHGGSDTSNAAASGGPASS